MPSDQGSLLDQIFAAGGDSEAGFLKTLSDGRLEKLLVHSELPPQAVMAFGTYLTVMDRFGSKVLKTFARRFLQAEVIKDRKRALELVELYQAARMRQAEEE